MIKIKHKLMDRMFQYAKNTNGEIGGLLLGKNNEETGKIIVKKAIILKQKACFGAFDIDDEALMQFTKDNDDDVLSSVIGWWHSHHNFIAEYSLDDEKTFKRLCEFFGGMCVGVVVNKKEEFRWRIDFQTKNGKYVNIENFDVNVVGKTKYHFTVEDATTIQTDVNIVDGDEVCVDYGIEICPRCRGSGVIEARRYLKDSKKDETKIKGDTFRGKKRNWLGYIW